MVFLVVLLILLLLVLHGLEFWGNLVVELLVFVSGLNFNIQIVLELGKLVLKGVNALVELLLQRYKLLALLLVLGVCLDKLIKLLCFCLFR